MLTITKLLFIRPCQFQIVCFVFVSCSVNRVIDYFIDKHVSYVAINFMNNVCVQIITLSEQVLAMYCLRLFLFYKKYIDLC